MLTPDNILIFTMLIGLAWAIVNFVFAIGVFQDTVRLQNAGRDMVLVPGPMWAFATLVGGILVATAYVFVHHSNLFDRDQ